MIIISYDIADDKLRTHFAKYLSKFGHRLQYSVFEINNSSHIIDNICLDLDVKFAKKISQADSIIIFKLNNNCEIIKYGYAKNDDEDFIVVK